MKRKLALSLLTSVLLTSCNNYTNYPEEEYKNAIKITANGDDCTEFSRFEYDDYIFGFLHGKELLITRDLKEVDINIEFDNKYVEEVLFVDMMIAVNSGAFKESVFSIENSNQFTINLEKYKELYESYSIVYEDENYFIQHNIPFVKKMIENGLYRFSVTVMYTSGYKGYYVFSLTYGIESYWDDGSYHVFL